MDKSYTDTNTNSSDFPDISRCAHTAKDEPPGCQQDGTRFHLTHARHDCAICLAPGLFRSLEKGKRKRQKLDITYQHGRESVQFLGDELLGADDLRVLQVLVAAAGPSGRYLDPEPKTEFGAKLGTLLERRGSLNQKALFVEKGQTLLLREIGLTDGGDNLKALRESLRRMAAVTIIVKRGRLEGSCRILSYAVHGESGALVIALNPRIAYSVVTGRRYTRIEMSEVRALKGDPARLIHQRLCGWIDPGSSGRMEVNTLVGYVWPEAASTEATKKRRQAARRALGEIAGVGWRVTQYARGKYEIWRQKAGSS